MGSSLARLLAMSQMGQTAGQNPLEAMIAMQMGQQQRPMSAPQNPIPSQLPPQAPRPPVRSGVPGLLSRFGGSVMNTLAPDPGEQVTSLIGKDAIKAAQSQALLSLGASLLSNSGWQDRPVTIGEALGKGLQASQATYGNAVNGAVNNSLAAQNAASWAEQRQAQADANTALAQQRATENALNANIAKARPEYAQLLTGMERMTIDQKYARYSELQAKALAAGDTDTYNKAENAKTALLQNQPRTPDVQYEKGGDGQLLRVERQSDGTVKEIPVGRPTPIRPTDGSDGGDVPEGIAVSDRPAYNALEKKAATIADHGAAYGSLQSALADPKVAANPTEQYNLLFQFVKSRDNSVVRASELALLNSANPTDQKIGLWISNKFSGQTMTLPMLRRIVEIMGREVGAQRAGLAADPRLGRLKRQGYALPEIEAIASPVKGAGMPTFRGKPR